MSMQWPQFLSQTHTTLVTLKIVTVNVPRLFILLLAQHFTLLSILNYFWLQKDKMAADKLQPKNNW